MIHSLIEAAVARLRDELSQLAPPPVVLAGPAAAPAPVPPHVVLSPGRLEMAQTARDGPASAPRPQPMEERLPLDSPYPAPLRLAHMPLQGTARARLVLSEGLIDERGLLLREGEDFAIDYRDGTLTLATDLGARLDAQAAAVRAQIEARAGHPFNVDSPEQLSRVLFDELGLPDQGKTTDSGYHSTDADVLAALADQHPIVAHVQAYRALRRPPLAVLRLEYAFAGVFTVREFQQALLVDVYGGDGGEAARLASLVAAVLLTDQDPLRRAAEVGYASNRTVSTSHRVARLDLAEGATEACEGGVRVRLTFQAAGQLRLVRAPRDGVGIIERVQSPGSSIPGAIAIRAELG